MESGLHSERLRCCPSVSVSPGRLTPSRAPQARTLASTLISSEQTRGNKEEGFFVDVCLLLTRHMERGTVTSEHVYFGMMRLCTWKEEAPRCS